MQSHEEGQYVEWRDYQWLLTEKQRLYAEVERLTELNAVLALRYDATNSMLDGCAKEIEEMEAHIESLTKAGDEMAHKLENYGNYYLTSQWEDAKEGKQS
jgi:chromosome segregation ATPase